MENFWPGSYRKEVRNILRAAMNAICQAGQAKMINDACPGRIWPKFRSFLLETMSDPNYLATEV